MSVFGSAGEGDKEAYFGEVAYPLGEDAEGEGGCACPTTEHPLASTQLQRLNA